MNLFKADVELLRTAAMLLRGSVTYPYVSPSLGNLADYIERELNK